MTVPRFPSLLVSALCLAGCAAGPPGGTDGRYPAARYPAGDTEQDRPLASLPAAAGRVVAVRRIPYANGFGQEIVLDGPRAMSGENRITVQALTTAQTGMRGQGAEDLRLGPPTDTEVTAEMDRALPGAAMRVADAPERGEDGAIGYATGTMGRLSCVYAWQYIAPAHPLSLLEGASGTGALPMSVRVRLCREGSMAAAVASLRGLRVAQADGAAAPAPLPSAGDALTAAVGSERPEPARGAAVADDAGGIAEPARPRRGGLRERRRASAPRRHRAPRAVAHVARRAVARRRDDAERPLSAPRIPLPGDAAPPAAAVAAPQPQRATAADAMPMPR